MSDEKFGRCCNTDVGQLTRMSGRPHQRRHPEPLSRNSEPRGLTSSKTASSFPTRHRRSSWFLSLISPDNWENRRTRIFSSQRSENSLELRVKLRGSAWYDPRSPVSVQDFRRMESAGYRPWHFLENPLLTTRGETSTMAISEKRNLKLYRSRQRTQGFVIKNACLLAHDQEGMLYTVNSFTF